MPSPTLSGTPLRGYSLTAGGVPSGATAIIQARSGASAAFTDTTLNAQSFPLGNGVSPNGGPGREYRLKVDQSGSVSYSSAVGPVGITDTVLPSSNAFYSAARDISSINTDAVGSGSGLSRGTDYADSISYYLDDFGANATIRFKWPVGSVSSGQVLCYLHFSRNNYNTGVPAAPVNPAIFNDMLGPMTFSWNVATLANSSESRTHLIEWFTTNSATSTANANKTGEIGIIPTASTGARGYFNGPTGNQRGFYTDESGLNWQVCDMPGPVTVNGGRYVVALEPSGVPRLSGALRLDRYVNWCLAQNIMRSGDYFTGIASGLEITAAGGEGGMTGKWMPRESEMPWSPAAAYTFDSDVAAYFARFTNRPGMNVRKAIDTFVVALKARGWLATADLMFFFLGAGAVDMRREFKTAFRDLQDTVGSARYVPGQGISYSSVTNAPVGYGTIPFNPADAAGNWTRDSAFFALHTEADPGAVSADWFGNAGVGIGRPANVANLKTRINSPTVFGGGARYSQLNMVSRVTAANYQVKRGGNTVSNYDPNPPQQSQAVVSSSLELGRAGSGSVYSPASHSFLYLGAGLNSVDLDTFGNLVVTMRSAVKNAGL